MRNNNEYLAALRQPPHPLVAHAWFTKFAYRQDLLHNFDHHGLTSHILANVLWCHVSSDRLCNVFPGNTTAERLDFMNEDIMAFYSAKRVNNRLPTLKASNLKKSDDFLSCMETVSKLQLRRLWSPTSSMSRKSHRAQWLHSTQTHAERRRIVAHCDGRLLKNPYFCPRRLLRQLNNT